jgi:hypothetical protein
VDMSTDGNLKQLRDIINCRTQQTIATKLLSAPSQIHAACRAVCLWTGLKAAAANRLSALANLHTTDSSTLFRRTQRFSAQSTIIINNLVYQNCLSLWVFLSVWLSVCRNFGHRTLKTQHTINLIKFLKKAAYPYSLLKQTGSILPHEAGWRRMWQL